MSTGAWLRLQAMAWKTPKISVLSDAAFRLWIATMSEAKLQRPGGSFGSLAHWRQCVGGLGASVKAERELLDVGILETAPQLCGRCVMAFPSAAPGTLVIHDWDEFQINTGAERQRRYRSRDSHVTRDANVTLDIDRDNDSDSDSDSDKQKEIQSSKVNGWNTTGDVIKFLTTHKKP